MGQKGTNPYVGLRPYNDEESLLFFGRKDQTMELLQRLHRHHFVAVVGSSGCGKSSLLRAGLIPSLKAGYLVDDSDQWFIAIMKPGQDPLYNLIKVLLQELYQNADKDSVEQLLQTVEEEGVDALLRLFKPLYEKHKTNFFLLVDQFEELFRYVSQKTSREQKDRAIDFVNIILELSRQQELPVYVVLTMRSDFIGDCSQFFGLPEAMNQSLYLVPRLNRQQLKMVIEGPARLYGGRVNASLSSKLLNQMARVQDELPLLQHALMRLWEYETEKGKDGELDLEDYQAIGGLENALSNHADLALKTLNKAEFQIAKQLFQALTTVDEHGRKTRRPAKYGELLELTGATEAELDKVIRVFIDDRRSFLMVDEMPDKKDSIIDISHESLIRQWKRLGRWVEEDGESAAIYNKLAQDYLLYKEGKKDLLKGTELHLASEWYDRFQPTSAWAARFNDLFSECTDFLNNSKQAEKKEKRNKKVFRAMLWSLGVLLLLVVAGFISYPFYRDYVEEMEKLEQVLTETRALYKDIQMKGGEPEEGISPQEPYLELLDRIDKQTIFYKKNQIVSQTQETAEEEAIVPDSVIRQRLLPEAAALRDSILIDLEEVERQLDKEYWTLASTENTVESYANYIQTAKNYRFKNEARNLEEAEKRQGELSEDPQWTQAQTENTVDAYLKYIVEYIEENNLNTSSSSIETLTPRFEEALGLAKGKREGWLFAGRVQTGDVNDDSLMDSSRVFDLVFRLQAPQAEVNLVPKIGDFLEAKSNRAAYNEFTGNSVQDKKGGFIKKGNLVLVVDRKALGDVVFLKVAY